jgi:hypothetical protein
MDDAELELLPLPEDMPTSVAPEPVEASPEVAMLVEVATPPPFLHSFEDGPSDLLSQEQSIMASLPATRSGTATPRSYFSSAPWAYDDGLDLEVEKQPEALGQSPLDSEYDEFEKVAKRSPPYLVSIILHMTVLIVLGLWMMYEPKENNISLEVSFSDVEVDQLEDEPFELGTDEDLLDPEVDPQSEMMSVVHQEIFTPIEPISETEDLLQVPFRENSASLPDSPNNDFSPPHIGRLLKGRKPELRPLLRRKYGGTEQTEVAVNEALEWLVRNQQADGSWSLTRPFSNGAQSENDLAATSLALLALQGDGHTPDTTMNASHAAAVAKGWKWMLSDQNTEARSGAGTSSQGYARALCTIAICEIYGMTGDEKYHKPAQQAVNYCLEAQGPNGGWRYNKGEPGDMSVTGWYVMALQSAKMAYLDVPEETLARVSGFLDVVQAEGGRRYGYADPAGQSTPMTAEGLLCRQYLGWKHDDERLVDGVEYLGKFPIQWEGRNAYYWYYATQVLHHMEGEPWNRWNEVMREVLPAKQVKNGPERGSWDPGGDQWGPQGGRMYVTCLHTYMLEVYYRHLPIYKYRLSE